MNLAVIGLWHLGTVMSAVFAEAGHHVIAFDTCDVIERLRRLDLPVAEPGLRELVKDQVYLRRLRYEHAPSELAQCKIVWITYDTPVRDDDTADSNAVIENVSKILPFVDAGSLVVVSSQMPIGSVAELERRAGASFPALNLRFACSPENLRLGKSLAYLRNVDRFIIGVRDDRDAALLREALAPLSARIEVMSVESAEMTKHAVNTFLATSVAFINELAALCERTGADARDVERGLKSDARIGKGAYVRAGGPYAGGTLARDVSFVIENERRCGLEPLFFQGVRAANDYHASWLQRRFIEVLGDPAGRTIAVLGLVYKAGTDTLRGSNAVAFARWFSDRCGRVVAYDPALRDLADDLKTNILLRRSATDTLQDADAAFVATDYDEFKELDAAAFMARMSQAIIFDPGRFLSQQIQTDARLRYYAIGMGHKT